MIENLFSFILLLLIGAAGFLTIYLVVDFFEYLKKYQIFIWEEICFKKPFGIQRDDFFFYPVKPLTFIPFLFNDEDAEGGTIAEYKKRIKLSTLGLIGLIIINLLFRIFV